MKEAHEAWEVQQVGKELSFIKDPIAIPYLAKLIGRSEEWYALQGLKHIDTDEAWEAVIPIVNSEDKVTAEYAKSLLRKKLPEINDPRIRKKIADAVR